MTTAHRPTWKAAVGKASEGGWSAGGAGSGGLSVLDMPAHTKLKFRKGNQVVDRQEALKESLRKLEKAEKEANKKLLQRPAVDESVEEEGRLKLLKQTAEVDETAIQSKYDDADASDDSDGDGDGWSEAENDDLDASSSDEDDSDDDDSDDEDEEAALQEELAKIRAEREAEKQKQEGEEAARNEEKLEEAALLGNPLLAGGSDDTTGRLKRRWNEDVVFRNQAKDEPEIKKRFINDTVRNDFHKRFLNKFIR
uniref:Cwf15/Cwc15 cell cycle control protein n=1 Tax=Pseudo-nitzschia australis TaxID=44445 RepID=A0A7S4AM55_9STRA|mmetsp:Transcript_23272/g.48865  ORF Transcript_23272/g.48865 Transcript_23272/m.48865 type:complete len:253 (+) Transcript_23272:190-948(+)|eukprot:CAMPEP_0168193758 /NCGR_PEP_ID=MMETSP0139_2-20121125/18786_1 /TAXON_ID=44445 /ORGANISM="Pseudo-nitzschia australis, Strain 10249 10 AB" /LENGTH=252 /DNA_ID=CAMNT_0008117153 /DNA_START=127 /DNA_END=885 /DNA_ORIENTATION=-